MKALLEAALELPAEERRDFLNSADAQPAATRAEALALLEHVEAAGGTLSTPAALGAMGTEPDEPHDHVGERLGPWRITGPLASGGMGQVFVAERADGAFQAKAAVKVLRRGLDSEVVLRRFQLEQQTLARLHHPHIARLLDAGLTASGLPYFVMELIVGLPIDEFCRPLPLARRLALFLDLADAVAHAHRNLLLHRDLKPSNVLVTAEGEIKLLDFGIAKALEPSADAADTQNGQGPFTPLFASPEQIRGEPVGTATDVYSLGVLLYLLLTGCRPYGRHATTVQQALYAAVNEAPAPPEDLPADLARVLLKALEKDASLRFASVDAFAADVKSFLAGKPVSARPQSLAYVARKFAGRNKAAVAASALALVALVSGVLATTWQARQARHARDRANERLVELKGVLRDIVMRYGEAINALPGAMAVREQLLQDAAARFDRLAAESQDDAEIKASLASTYARLAHVQGNVQGASLDKLELADANAKKAIELAEQAEAAQVDDPGLHVWHARAVTIRGIAAINRKQPEVALRMREQAAARLREARRRWPADKELRTELGSVLIGIARANDSLGSSLGRQKEAFEVYAEAADLYQSAIADGDDTADTHQLGTVEGALAQLHFKYERVEEAKEHALRAAELRRRNLARKPDNTVYRDGLATESNTLGYILLRLGEALPALAATDAAWRGADALGKENPTSMSWTNKRAAYAFHHARALALNGRCAEALPRLDEHVAWLGKTPGYLEEAKLIRRLAECDLARARCLQALRRSPEALPFARAAESAVARQLEKNPPQLEALILHGKALAALASLQAAGRGRLLALARARYASAAAIRPLAYDDARAYRALMEPDAGRPR